MDANAGTMANAIRALSMDAVEQANSGHPGMPMGMADVATVLFTKFLKYDAAKPHWPDRDRFVLSAGHGSMLIYSLLHLTGYARPTIDDIREFRQLNGPCAGHPENFLLDGVEATTGPLGQGLAMAVGMAMAERHLNARFGDELVDHATWVVAGDGCLMEGINHEAAGLAGHLKLGRLNVIWDDNDITIDGSTALSTSEDVKARYKATGWQVLECDGHDFTDIERALAAAKSEQARPTLIAAKTVIGKGAPNKQGTAATHGAPLGEEEIAAAREELGWEAEPFVIPDAIKSAWEEAGRAGARERRAWEERLAGHEERGEFERRVKGELPNSLNYSVYMSNVAEEMPKHASRKASELALAELTAMIPEMIGGSADLTGSNNTRTKATEPFTAEDYSGRYVYYGIREFGMAAAMNGMALHGGIIPYGGTFLVFSDYCRAAIRLAALQRVRSIFVMTHNSIGLGEDGPTHQPVEHLQGLRMIPNLYVFRPADTLETAECWELALEKRKSPSLIALSRQGLPAVRDDAGENRSACGAYRLREATAERALVIVATGSEVKVALDCAEALEKEGHGADVVSMPCSRLFDEEDESYRERLLPSDALIVSIEAGTTFGWERYTGRDGLNFGIDRFGASAPGAKLFEHFEFTAEKIVPQIIEHLQNSGSQSVGRK